MWAVQQVAENDAHRAPSYSVQNRKTNAFLTVHYLGAQWNGTAWIHEFLLAGVGFHWTEYIGSSVEQAVTSELAKHEIDIEVVSDVENGTVRLSSPSARLVHPPALERRLEIEVGRNELATILADGAHQPDDVDWTELNDSIEERINETVVYEFNSWEDRHPKFVSVAMGTPFGSIGETLIDIAVSAENTDRLPARHNTTRRRYTDTAVNSYTQAHYTPFEVITLPEKEHTIEVTSGFATTDGDPLGIFTRDYWTRNSIEITILPLSRPHPRADNWGPIRRLGARKPEIQDVDDRGTVLESDADRHVPPESPQDGATYTTDQEVFFTDTAATHPEIIDSTWWIRRHSSEVNWWGLDTNPVDFYFEGTITAIHVQKWSDGQTLKYPREFELEDDVDQ